VCCVFVYASCLCTFVNLDHVICLNISIAFSNTVILVLAYKCLLRKIGLLIITSRKSHLFTGVQSLKTLWQNPLRAALDLDLEPLTPILGFKGPEGSANRCRRVCFASPLAPEDGDRATFQNAVFLECCILKKTMNKS
jgi:hypothetical protein